MELGKLDWCGVPFMGGACELPHINCRSGVANDLHRHVINLARVVRSESGCKIAAAELSEMLFHEDEFRAAQQRCRSREVAPFALGGPSPAEPIDDILWAVDYFVCCWMGPGAKPGKGTEFTSYFASRWSATGGASVTRFRSAVESLLGWTTILKKWEFRVLDAFAFLGECADKEGHGIYCDPPWPEQGAEYKFAFSRAEHEQLARKLSSFEKTRVVVRYGDHPLIRSLYTAPRWRFVESETKNQAGNAVPEVLIVNGPEFKA